MENRKLSTIGLVMPENFPIVSYEKIHKRVVKKKEEHLESWKQFAGDGSLRHNDTDDMYYYYPVNFNLPDGSTYFIKSIGMRFKDNLVNGYIIVHLNRENLYTGAWHVVALWNSGQSEASSSVKTASKGTELGVKLVDTKKFTHWLEVWFYVFGDVNPSNDLILYQVRIHYGT